MAFGDRNSDPTQISANTHNIPDDSVDCGIRSLGWCRGATCQKYARLRTFLIVLACAGIMQGACESYFRISAKQAALENDYDPLIVDWLLTTSGLVQVAFALAFAYWAFKVHAISWLGGTIMLQAAVCVIAVIPSIYNFSHGVMPSNPQSEANVCVLESMPLMNRNSELSPEDTHLAVLILLFVLQCALGMGTLAFYIIGVIYIDDNSLSIDSPAVIATALGARIFGLQIGSFIVLGVGFSSIGWWLGWIIIAPFLFATGIMLSLYPKRLPKTVIHQAAQRIIEESRLHQFGSTVSAFIDDPDFWPSLKRLCSNKLLMFNLLSIMFIQAASINFMAQEETYLQSRFYLPYSEEDGLLQEWRARFVAYFLKPPVATVGLLFGGLLIAKLKLSGRAITGINIGLGVHLMLIYIAFIFIKCDVGAIANIQGGKLQQPYCSSNCAHSCSSSVFDPVCPENSSITYFSACYAGCTTKKVINNIEFYDGCTCTGNGLTPAVDVHATEGACSATDCAKMLIIFQVLSLIAATLLGMSTIGKIIITLRAVLPQDKPLALALEVTLVGFFTYVPTHISYGVVSSTTCLYKAHGTSQCLLRETPKHGNILDILTACLIFAGIIFDILVFLCVKGLNLYNCKVTDVGYTPSLYSPVPPVDSYSPPAAVAPAASNVTQNSSPTTTTTTTSPVRGRRSSTPTRAAPARPVVNVFRNPSTLTNSSAGETSVGRNDGITYAQVVFPPDKNKKADGSTSPKRMAVRADVPLQHLSQQDVRQQLNALRSFNPNVHQDYEEIDVSKPLMLDTKRAKAALTETDLDAAPNNSQRPQSPETDF